jgi:sugar lactone lactonase YvrE
MKTNKLLPKPLILAAGILVWCGLNLRAQTGPTITNQPVDQVVTNGGTATFSVGVNGTGPFTYQWQFNSNNIAPFITTVVGNGMGTYSGDGGAATNASLQYPDGVAFDASDNLYIADWGNRIRKVDTNGIITTMAGNGNSGYSGDGGAATNASLNVPSSLAFDASGNLFIADQYNNRIRKVDTNGIITTMAGNGNSGYSGDGGAATNASLNVPYGVALDAFGNLYIADSRNSRIRKVDTNGIITTVAGNGSSGYSGDGGAATNASLYSPSGLAFDASGDLCIADSSNYRIRKVDTNGMITTVAGNGNNGYSGDGGAATNAMLDYPYALACDSSGNLYIADYFNNLIREVGTNGVIATIAGNGLLGYSGDGNVATNAALHYPSGVAVDSAGNVFVADTENNRIRKIYAWPANLSTLTVANVTTNNIGNYLVIISNAAGSVTSSVAALYMPPFVTVQPASQPAAVGSSPTFSVAAAGPGPFGYEWFFAGTNLIQSGTNNSLTLPSVSTNNTGNYTVVVTNNYGSVTSHVATLMVGFPPTITTPPASLTNVPGTIASFSVAVNGTGPFTYQWQFNGANLPNNIITTVAGNGTGTYAGNGGAATNASLYDPSGVAFDASGNLYIADEGNNRIRKVGTNNIITTVAGNGTGTYAGNGGAATNASLYDPYGVAFDASGNLYIADEGNNRIRKVGTNGIITTVAGNGSAAYAGDGGAATNASLHSPSGVAFDNSGNLFIADWQNNRIRKVDTNNIITTVAGNGGSGYSGDGGAATNASLLAPWGEAFDAFGNLYIADAGNSRIRKVDTNGIITTVAGNGGSRFSGDGGAATNANLNSPSGVAFDAVGNLYIADYLNCRIRKVGTNGIITTVAGLGSVGGFYGDGGAATSAGLLAPFDLSFDASGNLLIADKGNNRIRKVLLYAGYPTFTINNIGATNAGNYSVVVTSPYGSITSSVAVLYLSPAITSQPASQIVAVGSSPSFTVAVVGSGPFGYELYFAGTNLVQSSTNSTLMLPNVSTNNTGNYTVVVTNNYGSVTSQVATLTVALPPSVNIQPAIQTNLAGTAVTFSATVAGIGPFSYQWQFNGTNLPNNIITTVAGNGYGAPYSGGYSGDGGAATNASLYYPYGVAFDVSGNILIADSWNSRIRKVDTNGIITTVAGNGGSGYSGDGGAATNAYAELNYPEGVGFDAFGNLYIADKGNNRIRKVDTNGIITTVAGKSGFGYFGDGGAAINASLYYPWGVASDVFGNLYIADAGNNRIRKVDTNGIITTVAGNGRSFFSGDGGAATNASLYAPFGVAFDAFGNLYIADYYNNCIRKVDTNGIITTVAGHGTNGDGGAATNASLYNPSGLAFDASGNLFIADRGNNRIRRVDTNGIITTVAGRNGFGYSGDGGAATNASLYNPSGLAFDASGNLFIADQYNNRIREVHFAGYPIFALTSVSVTNVGNYTVIVTSPYGSVTSSVVSLSVIVPPQIIASGISFGFATNQFGFNISGAFGQTIVVDGSTNLVDWTPLFTNTAGNNPFYFFDPASTNLPGRFYRARLP